MSGKEFFVIVTERDHTDWRQNRGAIVGETYLAKASLEEQEERAAKLAGSYGQAAIARLVFLGEDLGEDQRQYKTERDELAIALELFLDAVEDPPERNCPCHISAPCNDCVNHSGLREAFSTARAALFKIKGGAACAE